MLKRKYMQLCLHARIGNINTIHIHARYLKCRKPNHGSIMISCKLKGIYNVNK